MTASSARWLLLLVFLVPVMDPTSPFTMADDFGRVFVTMFVAAGIFSLLLPKLSAPWKDSLWAWVFAGLFLQGYYLRSYLFARDVVKVGYVGDNPEMNWVSLNTIAACLPYVTAAFAAVCLASWLSLTFLPPAPEPEEPPGGLGPWVVGLVSTALAVGVSCGVVQYVLGIGVMGMETARRLPLLLDSVVIHSRLDLAPALVYLAIWLSDRSEDGRHRALPLAALVVLGLMDGALSTSRGSLLKLALPLLFLWLLTGRLTRRRFQFLALAVGLTILLHPVISALRSARMNASGPWEAVASAVTAAWLEDPTGSLSTNGQRIVERVTGAEGVWFSVSDMPVGIDLKRLAGHFTGDSLTVYYTKEVVGVTRAADFRSPGLVGFSMLIGGWQGAVILPFLVVLGVRAVWWPLGRLRSSPVALSLWTMAMFLVVMEGTFAVSGVVFPLGAVAAVELVYRALVPRRSITGAGEGGAAAPLSVRRVVSPVATTRGLS